MSTEATSLSTFKFSPSCGVFFPDDVPYDEIPNDLITVEPGGYEKVMSRRPEQTFDVSPEGVVTLLDPTPDQLAAAALANFKVSVDTAIKAAREKALTYFMVGEVMPPEWVSYNQALFALRDSETIQPLPTPPQP